MLGVIYGQRHKLQALYAVCHYAEWNYARYHYAEWHYAECYYAECRGAFSFYVRKDLGSIHL